MMMMVTTIITTTTTTTCNMLLWTFHHHKGIDASTSVDSSSSSSSSSFLALPKRRTSPAGTLLTLSSLVPPLPYSRSSLTSSLFLAHQRRPPSRVVFSADRHQSPLLTLLGRHPLAFPWVWPCLVPVLPGGRGLQILRFLYSAIFCA